MKFLTTFAIAGLYGLAAEAAQKAGADVFLFRSQQQSHTEHPRVPKEVARHIFLQRVRGCLLFTRFLLFWLTASCRHHDPATEATCAISQIRLMLRPLLSTLHDMARAPRRSLSNPKLSSPPNSW